MKVNLKENGNKRGPNSKNKLTGRHLQGRTDLSLNKFKMVKPFQVQFEMVKVNLSWSAPAC